MALTMPEAGGDQTLEHSVVITMTDSQDEKLPLKSNQSSTSSPIPTDPLISDIQQKPSRSSLKHIMVYALIFFNLMLLSRFALWVSADSRTSSNRLESRPLKGMDNGSSRQFAFKTSPLPASFSRSNQVPDDSKEIRKSPVLARRQLGLVLLKGEGTDEPETPTPGPSLPGEGEPEKDEPEKKPEGDHPHEGTDAGTVDFWIKMALIVTLVMIGGVFAGLTLGLMGLDETNLHVLMVSGTPEEQVHAETVYNLLSRGKHWVLVTLLLGNVIVNETLPVVLDSELGGGVFAILISTLLIVIFGEIIPQAVCARYGLAIGSYMAKPMVVFMYIMSPVAYPVAMLLDSWLGVHHGTTYRKAELKTLVSLHQAADGIGELTDDEVTIIASVLDLKEKPVSSVMTPLEDVFTLSEDDILDEALMEEIVNAGYSRIPIYRHDNEHNFIGMLLVKRLITYDPEDHIAVRDFPINSLPEIGPETSCLDLLNFFQEGRSHMAMVTSEPSGFGEPVGVITLEDVIEELLGEEIVDESDVYVDVHSKIRVIRKPSKTAGKIRSLKNLLQSPALSSSSPLLGSLSRRMSGDQTQKGSVSKKVSGSSLGKGYGALATGDFGRRESAPKPDTCQAGHVGHRVVFDMPDVSTESPAPSPVEAQAKLSAEAELENKAPEVRIAIAPDDTSSPFSMSSPWNLNDVDSTASSLQLDSPRPVAEILTSDPAELTTDTTQPVHSSSLTEAVDRDSGASTPQPTTPSELSSNTLGNLSNNSGTSSPNKKKKKKKSNKK